MDLNGDGQEDILSGCYMAPNKSIAYLYALYGLKHTGRTEFSAPLPLVDASDEPITLPDEVKQAGSTMSLASICVHPFAHDWDHDGDLDLLVGNFEGSFCLVRNEGTPQEARYAPHESFIKGADGKNLVVPGQHSAPFLVDWDADGDYDLVSGSSQGGVYLAENTGTRSAPNYSGFVKLIDPPPADKAYQQYVPPGANPLPAGNTRIWVADYNGDGKLDVLAGDSVTIESPRPGHEKDAIDKQEAALAKERSALMERSQKIQEAYSKNTGSAAASEAFQEAMEEISKGWQELDSERREYLDSTSTGFVWLYLQKERS